MPAAMVIPAPLAYIKVVAVKSSFWQVGDSSSGQQGESSSGFPTDDSPSRLWGEWVSASAAINVIGDSSSGH